MTDRLSLSRLRGPVLLSLSILISTGALRAAVLHDHAGPAIPAGTTGIPAAGSPPASGETVVDVPTPDIGADTLAARAQAELATAAKFRVFHDFHFSDRLPESGISFSPGIVDDAGKSYKAAHYDHGCGLAVADIDGDGLLDVFFVNQLGGSELWRNLGGGRFENVTQKAGVALPGAIGVSATFADIDNDGAPDLYVTTVRSGNRLFRNDGKGHFRDVTQESGLGYVGHSSAAVFFDFDRDGLLDLFLVNVGKYTTEERGRGGAYVAFADAFQGQLHPERTERSILYKNMGNHRFVDVSKAMHLEDGSWSGDASIADWNGDGWPDLYVLNMQGDNHYYENQGGKAFVDATEKYFPKTPWGAMGIKVFDYNNDGRMDLLITDMHSDMIADFAPQDEKSRFPPAEDAPQYQGIANNIFGNAFFEYQGGGKFVEKTFELNLENYWPWGVSTGDLNADGWQDVLITASMNYPFRYGVNSLLINDQGEGFRDASFILGIEPRRGGKTRKPWFTLDCSGPDSAHQGCKGRTGKVVVTGTLGTRSAAIFDLDNDGDLDIVTNEFNSEPQVFVSDLAQKKAIHWLKVKLVGTKSNRDGLGARVEVKVGGRTLTQVHDGNSGYLSHSLIPLYFGLGDADKADALEIVWPSGIRQAVPGPIAGNRQLVVTEAAPGK